jgi:hypothetical protein
MSTAEAGTTGRQDPAAELEQLVLSGAQWLHTHHRHLDPADPLVPTERSAFPEGPLLETVVLCRALRDSALGARMSSFTDDVLDLAERVTHRPETRQRLATHRQLLPYVAHLLALVELGDRMPGFRLPSRPRPATVEDLLRGRPTDWLVELRYALDLTETDWALPPMTDLLSRAGLWSSPDVPEVDDAAVYRLTHLVFYASDFGRRDLSGATEDRQRLLWRRLRCLERHYRARADWDLTAELMLCARAAQGRPDDGPRRPSAAWSHLLQAALPDGAIPGPHYSAGVAHRMPDAARRSVYSFRTNYHTTVVAALAALDALRQCA